jgi:hypothetical protein
MVHPAQEETVHKLPHAPVHLYQLNADPGAYSNKMGCGAFTTAMALSCYDPVRFGKYAAARRLFDRMRKVPFFGGTFEGQNAVMGRRYGFFARSYDNGTPADLAAAIDCGAPTIMLVRPGFLGIGLHDVLLVGYSVDALGSGSISLWTIPLSRATGCSPRRGPITPATRCTLFLCSQPGGRAASRPSSGRPRR